MLMTLVLMITVMMKKVDRELLMTNDLAKDALAPIWMVGDGRAKDAESQFGKGSTLGWPPLLSTG